MYKLSDIAQTIHDSNTEKVEYKIRIDTSLNAWYILHELGEVYQDMLLNYLFIQSDRIYHGCDIEKPAAYFDKFFGDAQFKYNRGGYKSIDPYVIDDASVSYTSAVDMLSYGYRALKKRANKIAKIKFKDHNQVRRYFVAHGLHMDTYLNPYDLIIPIKNRSYMERDIIVKHRIRIPKYGVWRLKEADINKIPFEASLGYCKFHVINDRGTHKLYITVRANQQPRDEDGYINMKKRKD